MGSISILRRISFAMKWMKKRNAWAVKKKNLLANVATRPVQGRHHGGLSLSLQNLFVEDHSTDRRQRGDTTLHVVSVVVRPVVSS